MANDEDDPCTSSVVRACHVLNVDGYSRTLGMGTQSAYLESCPFRAGGRSWGIRYYPMGTGRGNAAFVAVFLLLLDADIDGDEDDVMAQVTFGLLDQQAADHGRQKTFYSRTTPVLNVMQQQGGSVGYEDFITREELEKSGLVKDDCFAVRVDLHLVGMSCREESASSSGMQQHFGALLSSSKGTDVEFHVRGETFAAHRLVLRARSPVFKALLLKARANTSNTVIIEIDDMEPRVFKALLTFIYTDAWPNMEQDDDDGSRSAEEASSSSAMMARGLLVAADRYGLQRLKLMCENWLCNRIDRASILTLLALSEKHHCANLKDACFDFISSLTLLNAINDETGGLHDLAQCYPNIANELTVNAINRDREKEKSNAASLLNMGNDRDGVIKTSRVARANNSTTASSLFYLFSGFVISVIINSYVGV